MTKTTDPPRRHYAGLSADDRDSQRRQRLVEAGIASFGADGYAAATVDSVCGAARVSTRDFYGHFSNKEELLLAVYDHIVESTLSTVDEALRAPRSDPAEVVRAGLQAFVDAMVRDKRWARINFIEIVGVSDRAESRRRKAINDFATQLRDFSGLLATQPATGWVRLSEIRSIALVGAVHETITDWLWREARPPLEDVVDEFVALFDAVTKK